MKKVALMLLLTLPSLVQASFNKESEALRTWLQEHPEANGVENIEIQTQVAGKVPAHRRDDINWADNCLNGLTLWSSGPNPVPGAFKFICATVLTAGVWPAGVLIVSGCAYGLEKAVKSTDYRRVASEHQVFNSERNLQRYYAERMLELLARFHAANAPFGGEQSATTYRLYLEVADLLGIPLLDDAPKNAAEVKAAIGDLAPRINRQIENYKPVDAYRR